MFDITQSGQWKQHVRASFDQTGPGYGADGDFHWQFAARLLDHAPLRPGTTVVDIATGTAPAARIAAQRVGTDGHIIGLDLSRGILAQARRHIASDGLAHIRLVCGDAEALPLGECSVDGLLCSSAIVWLPDIPRALRDWRRVLRPGGWIAFSCFGGPARQTIISLLGKLLLPYGQRLPELNARLNSAAKSQKLLSDAGYRDIVVHQGLEQQLPTAAEQSFAWACAGLTRFNIELEAEQREAVKAYYIKAFEALVPEQEHWNQDYEQYVVAYR